jgi:ankyrin repeat protein
MLLQKGANVDHCRGYYGYALHVACVGGYESIVDMLLDYSANAKALGKLERAGDNWYEIDSLTIACARGHKAIVRLLLDRGHQSQQL